VGDAKELSGRSCQSSLTTYPQRMPNLPFYKPHQLADLQAGYCTLNPAYERLMFDYLSLRLTNEAAQEYARHGFLRRLGTLKRSIENVYSTHPPERCDKPSRDECLDLAINLQSFLFNVFGCIDNLARVWVSEKQLKDNQGRPLRDQQIGLRSRCTAVRETFSAEFQKYLTSRDDWLSYLDNYRHALAHRIPLYIAPYTLNPAKLEEHNELERRKTEAQTKGDCHLWSKLNTDLADWNTVVELANEFLTEINRG
jgi:hypothetical protein